MSTHGTTEPFGLRPALPEDIARRDRFVLPLIKGMNHTMIAHHLAIALNQLEESTAILRNQRKRLAELQDAANAVPAPKLKQKYFAPQDGTELLEKLRAEART